MNKKLTFLLSLFLLSFTSAIYVGESITYPNTLNSDNLLYTIIDNESYITYPIIEINLTNITLTIPDNSNPNSYKIIFVNNEKETQTIIVNSKGHSKTKIVNNTIIREIPRIEYLENKTIEYINNTIEKLDGEYCSAILTCNNMLLDVFVFVGIPTIMIFLFYYIVNNLNRKYLNKLDSSENLNDTTEKEVK